MKALAFPLIFCGLILAAGAAGLVHALLIATFVLAAVIWIWVLVLHIQLRPTIKRWEKEAEAKGWIKGVPGDYWLRSRRRPPR